MRAERQPIEQRFAGACCARGVQVLGVGGQNDVHLRKQRVGGSVQGPVLGGSGQRGKHSGGDPGAPRGVVDVLAQVGQRLVPADSSSKGNGPTGGLGARG